MTGDRPGRLGASLLRVRWFVRAPIWLYRARLGFLFGRRFLLLEHVGRRTGRRRSVVLEVLDRPTPDRYVVVSGFGARAQWFRNICAHPHVCVQVGGRPPTPAVAQRLDAVEAAATLDRYAAAHPRAWARLRPVLEHTLGTGLDTGGTGLPVVALHVVGDGRRR